MLPLTTPEFQQAQTHLAHFVRAVGTLDGIRDALQSFVEMIVQWRCHHDSVRGIIPVLMLQPDQDQRAYDLIKKTAVTAARGPANESSPSSPHDDENIFEHATYLDVDNDLCDINHICVALLLKTKLFMDMRNIRIVRSMTSHSLPAQIVTDIELAVVRSPLSVQFVGTTSEKFRQKEMKLNEHVLYLSHHLHKANSYLWKAFLESSQCLVDSPGNCLPGSSKLASFVIQYTYPAWYQTEGVIDAMRRAQAMSKDKDDMLEMWSNFRAALEF